MPATRQRKSNNSKGEGGRERKEESASGGSEDSRKVEQQQPHPRYQQQKKGVSWMPVFKTVAYFALAIMIPTLLNYAVLNQEARMLVPAGNTDCTAIPLALGHRIVSLLDPLP